MDKKVKIAIIGAGTAGLSAYKEASKYTKDILVIDKGPLGSTCARVGCMPSKVLIQAANFFYSRHHFSQQGIGGSDKLTIHIPDVLKYVRSMRDQFTKGVVEYTKSLDQQFLCGEARFIAANTLKVGEQRITADTIIIANGSHSIIPKDWEAFGDKVLTSETIFEQNNLAANIGLIGAGSIGLEFGQSLSRLGISISAYNASPFIGGLSDPKVNEVAVNIFSKEFSLYLDEKATVVKENDHLNIQASKQTRVNQVIAAMGRAPNLEGLGLEDLDIKLDAQGIPEFDPTTMKIKDHSIYIAGDVDTVRPLLHEAADEGRIAAYNAAHQIQCFERRILLRILFTEPNIAVVGKAYKALDEGSFVTGEIDFSDQGRAKIMCLNKGLLRVYADKKSGLLLGAELIAPGGEHLAHLLAWAMDMKLTAFDILQMPFYHPVIEEGLRTALRQITKKVENKTSAFDLAMCDSEAIHC